MTESWTKDCTAQKNLTALLQEKIILPQMRSKALKSIGDPRIREIIKFNTGTINRKIISTWNEIKNDVAPSVGLVGKSVQTRKLHRKIPVIIRFQKKLRA